MGKLGFLGIMGAGSFGLVLDRGPGRLVGFGGILTAGAGTPTGFDILVAGNTKRDLLFATGLVFVADSLALDLSAAVGFPLFFSQTGQSV